MRRRWCRAGGARARTGSGAPSGCRVCLDRPPEVLGMADWARRQLSGSGDSSDADGESTYKRGSVHLRRGWAAIHLSDLPRNCLERPAGRGNSVFDLAPGGVYQATAVARGAGALLPHRFTLTCARLPGPSAVCFLWHCPARHHDSRFASTLPCGAPTFLATRRWRGRPVDSPSGPSFSH